VDRSQTTYLQQVRGSVETTTSLAELPRLLLKGEALGYLGASVRTVDRLRQQGKLEAVLVGASVRITARSLESLVIRQLGPGAAPETSVASEDPFAIPLLEELKAQAAERRASCQHAAVSS
jgi:hypothetical protein